MHGAIFVDDIDDPEGQWIEAVRDVVGEDCIVSVSFDLHGQMTDKIINNLTPLQLTELPPTLM